MYVCMYVYIYMYIYSRVGLVQDLHGFQKQINITKNTKTKSQKMEITEIHKVQNK